MNRAYRIIPAPAIALTLSLGFGVAATAADLRAPPPAPVYTKAPPPPAATWTGFYLGGNIGWGWADPSSLESDILDVGTPGPQNVFNPNGISLSSNGIVAGGHVGYNYQFAPTWVAGIEGDFDYAHFNRSGLVAPLIFGGVAPLPGSFTSAQATIEDPWSIRGRLGYAQPQWMVYGTGGYAQTRLNFSGDLYVPVLFGNAFAPASLSTTRSGWVLGGGVEFKPVPGPWTVGLEYLYYRFDGTDNLSAVFTPPDSAFKCAPTQACIQYSVGAYNLQTVRLRLSYKF
jgi:outer membrane immunogenic protein